MKMIYSTRYADDILLANTNLKHQNYINKVGNPCWRHRLKNDIKEPKTMVII